MCFKRLVIALPVFLLSSLLMAQWPAPTCDTTPLAGPGTGQVDVISHSFLSACPTILLRGDGKPFALCSDILTRDPVVRLLNQIDGKLKASLKLDAGSLLGGVYAFIDHQERLVMVDGNQTLLRIDAVKKRGWFGITWWKVFVDERVDISAAVTGHCGGGDCDAVVSLSDGANGVVWFATQKTIVGTYNPAARTVHTMKLAENERIDNSFSTTADGRAAIATNRALYGLTQGSLEQPQLVWRHAYDAGSARKPGQLSHGTGATPTFFGPVNGTEYVTITDNADDQVSLIIRRSGTGAMVCQTPVFDADNNGTENSAIGLGNTVIVASTYGYPYPAVPEGAGPSVPERADFKGGMTRVDVTDKGCHLVWTNNVRSAAVPKYSTFDGLIYTFERKKMVCCQIASISQCLTLNPARWSVRQRPARGSSPILCRWQETPGLMAFSGRGR